jgi:hypothetical protein
MPNHIYDTHKHVKPFVISEAPNGRSRDNGVVTQTGTEVVSGQLLAQADTGTAAFAMAAGSTGNPTSGVITVTGPALPGVYRGVFQSATRYQIETPEGVVVGLGNTGSAFTGSGLSFTLTAGGTPAVSGDQFTITVAAGTGKYVAYAANGTAGRAVAIAYNYLPVKTGDAVCVVFNADCEVNRFELTGLDAAAEADLARIGIKLRGRTTLGISTPTL